MKNFLLGLCVVVVVAGCGGNQGGPLPARAPLVAIMPAPEFDLENVKGGRVKSSDLKGKVVVLDLWATWCVPCKQEMPHYNELYSKLKDKGVEFVGLAYLDTKENVVPFLAELKIQYPNAMGTDLIEAAIGGYRGLPTTLVIGKDWKVYRKIAGSTKTKMAHLEADLNDLLAMQ
jgi:thiol-disulfide isomerase/thioredoxin